MSQDRSKWVFTIVLGLTAVVLAGIVAAQTWIIISLARGSLLGYDDLVDAFDSWVDIQMDAGHDDPLAYPDDPLLAQRKVWINHTINARSARDVSARLMVLDGEDPRAPIDLYISTQGGWVDSAFTIIDTMRLISAPVNTWAVGGCYSAGALILSAGTGRRYATENALIMVHANQDDLEGEYLFEPLALERYERAWKMTAHLPEDWFPMTFEESYYLSPEDAVRMGIADEVVPIWDPR